MDTIVLVHGYPGFVKLGALEYFRGVAQHLERSFDVEVIAPEIGPAGTIADRSGELEVAFLTGTLPPNALAGQRIVAAGRSDPQLEKYSLNSIH